MTIDPKAAELAKALADAVAAQQTEEYQELCNHAKKKELIDAAAENAAFALQEHYQPLRAGNVENPMQTEGVSGPSAYFIHGPQHDHLFDPPSEPERYELPEDETQTAKPNGGLSD